MARKVVASRLLHVAPAAAELEPLARKGAQASRAPGPGARAGFGDPSLTALELAPALA